ncbi:MAG TPA: hypothetical protein VFT31_06250 [Kribbella sp.]|nr:hypothetical protein [Kribbella sp.]
MVQRYGDTDTAVNDAATQRYEEARAAARQAMTNVAVETTPTRSRTGTVELPTSPTRGVVPRFLDPVQVESPYRGFKVGAAFFGWLIAIAFTVLLAGVVGAIAVAVGYTLDITGSDIEDQAGTFAIASGAVLVVVMSLAYYTGGYVAGRLARFDGGRQGFGVWMFALLVSVVAAGVGALADSKYDVLDPVDVPRASLSTDTLTTGGIITAAAVVVCTLLFALVGGKAGQRYHDKIDDWDA